MKRLKSKRLGYYIPSIDAKDLYIANNYISDDGKGYSLIKKDGSHNLVKYINSFDYSLDLIEIRDNIYYKKMRRKDLYFLDKGKAYSNKIINVTFKFSVKEWNRITKTIYVKFGYKFNDLKFEDCVAKNESGEIIGIKIQSNIEVAINENDLPEYFEIIENEDCEKVYSLKKEPKTIITVSELRKKLYKDGFVVDGMKFVRCKRSSGSARVGKCLFIIEPLFKDLWKFSKGNLSVKEGQEIDLAAFESYISLPTSSIIDTIEIKPENFLIIDDYESIFNEQVVATKTKDEWLETKEENVEIKNSIWDGESLMDISLFGKYKDKGMLLLRNVMFKSCCFNTNVQKWFQDNGITEISQLNGFTLATDISQVKVITTPSSIKYLKFSTIEDWLNVIPSKFGVVKYEKKTHFFDGKLVQTHYQLINTLQLDESEMKEFLKPSLDFAEMLANEPAVVRKFIKYPEIDKVSSFENKICSKSDLVYNLMAINDKFVNTKYYDSFLKELLKSYYKNLKNGHVLVEGNYSTLLGNPIEMLKASIGRFEGKNEIEVGTVRSTRFEYGTEILASRSPHVTMGNILVSKNVENKLIDEYINTTDEIICINSIGENILQRLSGADYDSDTMLITNNEILLKAAKRNYNVFKTPTSLVEANKMKRYYTAEQLADLDIKTSVNLIGEIINLSQELNSLIWHKMSKGYDYKGIEDIYYDACQLDIMSNIEIDSAKKEFEVNNKKELQKIRDKYQDILTDQKTGKKRLPFFFAHISRQKGYYAPETKVYLKYNTAMDYLQTVVNSFKRKNKPNNELLPLNCILDKKMFRSSNINYQQIEDIYSKTRKFINKRIQLRISQKDKDEKRTMDEMLKSELAEYINEQNIGFSTVCKILEDVEKKENLDLKMHLLEILFSCQNESFVEAFKKSKDGIKVLEDGGNEIELFGNGFHFSQVLV